MRLILPDAYRQVMESDLHSFLLYGGRLGGKSFNASQTAILTMLQHPYTDIIVCRVSYGSMADSSFAELLNAIQQMELENEFDIKKSPLRIERKGNAGTIYFIGYGGSNTSRTKSIRPKHKISMVIMEETQELKDKRNLDEALASFRRNFGDNVKVVIMGNPPPQEAHWFNVYIKEKQFDYEWLVKRVSYLDILPFINDFDLKEILKTKINDPEYYNWFYMGESVGGFGSVYPMFRENKHIITPQEFDLFLSKTGVRIVGAVIGGDGAVNRDSTAFTCQLLLNNGQSVVAPIFYHNPKDDGVIGYHQLVQDHLTRWVNEICERYHLGSIREMREHPNMKVLPIFMRVDSASPDLIQECRFFFGDRIQIAPIRKASVMEMVGVVQSALSNQNIMIIDYGGYYSYVKNKFIQKKTNLLAEQLSMLIWNEKQNNYDPIVPNDVADSFTYATYFWYRNQENIQFFNYLKINNVSNQLISDIIKK